MGLLGFSFGKKRRSKKSKKVSKKPPSKLLRLCKKYRVKATKKVGGKRVYKSISTLKKLCLKKAMALRKKLMKMKKKMSKKKTHRKKRRSHRRGGDEELMEFGRRRVPMFGLRGGAKCFDDMGKKIVGGTTENKCVKLGGNWTGFGKRRRVGAKPSKAAAMKAFKSFYKRHCAGRRNMRFGNGGNGPLSSYMGNEFCPSGMGGVLGAESTGLFPSPCTSMNRAQAAAEEGVDLPTYSSSFGYRRKRRSTAAGGVRRRRRSTAVGTRRKRRSTAAGGVRRRRRCTAVGSRRR